MIAHRSLHRREDVLAVIGADQRQDALCLALAIALLFEQPLQKTQSDFPQFLKAPSQLLNLLAMVLGGGDGPD